MKPKKGMLPAGTYCKAIHSRLAGEETARPSTLVGLSLVYLTMVFLWFVNCRFRLTNKTPFAIVYYWRGFYLLVGEKLLSVRSRRHATRTKVIDLAVSQGYLEALLMDSHLDWMGFILSDVEQAKVHAWGMRSGCETSFFWKLLHA